MKRYYFQVPSHVAADEAASLYRFMALGETDRTVYLAEKHQTLFDCLALLQKQVGMVGTQELCQYLKSQNLLNTAGGLAYVQKVFNCLEPAEVYQ